MQIDIDSSLDVRQLTPANPTNLVKRTRAHAVCLNSPAERASSCKRATLVSKIDFLAQRSSVSKVLEMQHVTQGMKVLSVHGQLMRILSCPFCIRNGWRAICDVLTFLHAWQSRIFIHRDCCVCGLPCAPRRCVGSALLP